MNRSNAKAAKTAEDFMLSIVSCSWSCKLETCSPGIFKCSNENLVNGTGCVAVFIGSSSDTRRARD